MTEPERTAEDECARREYALQTRQLDNAYGQALVRIWAPVVVLVFGMILALAAYAVYWHSRNDAAQHAPSHKVDVWCYDDPQSNLATRHYYGDRDLVQLACRAGAPAHLTP